MRHTRTEPIEITVEVTGSEEDGFEAEITRASGRFKDIVQLGWSVDPNGPTDFLACAGIDMMNIVPGTYKATVVLDGYVYGGNLDPEEYDEKTELTGWAKI